MYILGSSLLYFVYLLISKDSSLFQQTSKKMVDISNKARSAQVKPTSVIVTKTNQQFSND